MFVVLIGLYAGQVFYLMILNKRHAKTRERMGKPAILVDKSMKRIRARSAAGEEEDDTVERKAFDDKTDWENEDFIFVY